MPLSSFTRTISRDQRIPFCSVSVNSVMDHIPGSAFAETAQGELAGLSDLHERPGISVDDYHPVSECDGNRRHVQYARNHAVYLHDLHDRIDLGTDCQRQMEF
jgi:hypothetical protein